MPPRNRGGIFIFISSRFIDINVFHSYKYNINPMSKNLVLPKHENDILVFHGFKNSEFEKQLKENYLKTVLVQDDFLVKFENNTFWWIKNSFLQNKNIQSIVKFEVLKHGHIIYTLNNQDIFKYWGFFIENCNINPGYYDVRIVEETTNRVIYKNIIKI